MFKYFVKKMYGHNFMKMHYKPIIDLIYCISRLHVHKDLVNSEFNRDSYISLVQQFHHYLYEDKAEEAETFCCCRALLSVFSSNKLFGCLNNRR